MQRGFPGFMWCEAIDVQVKWGVVIILFDKPDCSAERPCGRACLLRLFRLDINQMRAYAFFPAVVAGYWCGVGVRNGSIAILRLATDELPLTKATREIHARHKVVRYISEETGVIALVHKGFGDCPLVRRHRLPARNIDVIPRHSVV